MRTSEVAEAEPAGQALSSGIERPSLTPAPAARPSASRRWARRFRVLAGWVWRLVVGSLLCLNYFTSVLVTGWTYRWMRTVVLRGWWKASRLREAGSFEDFCATLGPAAPVPRPRWFLQERIGETVRRPAPNGQPPGIFRKGLRLLRVPWHGLWLNLKVGVQALFCTYLLTAWGCMLMVFSWEFGWLNSFHKGYEQAAIGPVTGFLGIFLFIAAMFYVPMAQVHQAVTGDVRAFFDLRFVWRLIRTRLTAYAGLAALIALASLPLEILKTVPAFFGQINPALNDASDAEWLRVLRNYLIVCCFVLFPTLLCLRLVAACVYRSAVLKALRRGWVSRAELHPVLVGWLDRLELDPQHMPERRGVWWAVRLTGRPMYRGALYVALFVVWFAFVAKVYVGEFFNYHPFFGFFNHPLVQLPCFDYIPQHLQASPEPQAESAPAP